MKKHNKKNKRQHLEDNIQLMEQDEYIKDTSPIVPQRSKIKNPLHIYTRPDLTEKQKEFINLALDKNTKLIFVDGPAGTAKTHNAVYASLKLLNDKKVSDIIYIRSLVESADRSMGYLKGSESEKLQPYMIPLMDKLSEMLPKQEIDMLIKDERIIGMPINFLRGTSFAVRALILDESQNCTYKEIFTFITRIGEFCKVFVIGDGDQSDINGKSGFQKIMSRC